MDSSRVSVDAYDTLVVLENLTKPTVKHINQAGFSTLIDDDLYPTYNSPKNVDDIVDALWAEGNAMKEKYLTASMTQDELYWHPAGAGQFGGTNEELDQAQRVKVKLSIDTYVGIYHFTGIYVPPGELITIDIPDVAKGKVSVLFNVQTRDCGEYSSYSGSQKRIPRLYLGLGKMITLNQNTNTIGWPVGGSLCFFMSVDQFSEPIEVNISGGILAPWFRHGITTDEEWEQMRNYNGLVAYFETGNIQMIMPTVLARNAKNVSLAMAFMRSCAEIMDSVAPKAGYNTRRSNGRERHPVYFWFDSYIPIGEACAYGGSLICMLPYSYIDKVIDGSTVLLNCWGPLHEMGHHHQNGWEFHDYSEVTNNVLVLTCYSYYSAVTLYRTVSDSGGISIPDNGAGWDFTTHPYAISFASGSLQQWVSLLHAFGQTKFREFIKAYINQEYYAGKVYGWDESYALRGAVIFGYDLRPHMKFNGYDLDSDSYIEEHEPQALVSSGKFVPNWL